MSNLTIRIDDKKLKTKLDEYAKNKGVSRGEIIRKLLYKELEDKTTSRGIIKLKNPLELYFPLNENFYDKPKETTVFNLYYADLTNKDEFDFGIDDSFCKLKIKEINNCLDTWKNDTYKSRNSRYDHEGLIIIKDIPELYNIIFLIRISQTGNKYKANILTLNKSLEIAKSVKNKELYNYLIAIEHDEKEFNKLYENS